MDLTDDPYLKMLCSLRVKDVRVEQKNIHGTLSFWAPGTYYITPAWGLPLEHDTLNAIQKESWVLYCSLKDLKARFKEDPNDIALRFLRDMFKSPPTTISINYTWRDLVLTRGPLCENIKHLEFKAVPRLQMADFAGYIWKLDKVSLVDVCLLDAPH